MLHAISIIINAAMPHCPSEGKQPLPASFSCSSASDTGVRMRHKFELCYVMAMGSTALNDMPLLELEAHHEVDFGHAYKTAHCLRTAPCNPTAWQYGTVGDIEKVPVPFLLHDVLRCVGRYGNGRCTVMCVPCNAPCNFTHE